MYLIMKNILSKVYFHPLFILSTFIFILIGRFRFVCYFMLLIIVHELGHIFVSKLFKWKLERIIILPLGGIVLYDIKLNTPIIQEFFVSISGILFQFIFYFLINDRIGYVYFSYINYFIIIFNLLPIYPLDGSKIMEVFLNKITTYYNSLLVLSRLSLLLSIFIFIVIFKFNKLFSIVFIILIIKSIKINKDRKHLYNKFLLERYLYKFRFNKYKIIDSLNKLKKDYYHVLKINDVYIEEKEYLNKFFTNRK